MSAAFSSDAKGVISQCRALVISQKNPTRVQDLLREYRQVEGAPMNFRKYGFNAVEDFLVSSGEFALSRYNGETCITARPIKETEHLVKMVQRQKGTKKQISRKPYASSIDHSWNKSSYSSSVYPRLVERSPKKLIPKLGMRSSYGDKNNNNKSYKAKPNGQMMSLTTTFVNPNTKQQQQQQQQQQPKNNQQFDLRDRLQTKRELIPPVEDLRDRLNAKKGAKESIDSYIVSRAILGQNNKEKSPDFQNFDELIKSKSRNDDIRNSAIQLSSSQKKPVTKTTPTTTGINVSSAKPTVDEIKINSNNVNNRLRGVSAAMSKTSIQDRLRITHQMPIATFDIEQISASRNSSPSVISNNSVISSKQNDNKQVKDVKTVEALVKPPVVFEFDPKMDAIVSLAHYCRVRRIVEPDYKLLKMKFSSRIQCRVLVNEIMYSTYPDDFETKEEAMSACANNAIQQIQINEARNRFPICMDSDMELAMKIFQELRNHPHGIFCKNIPELFQTTFQETLPDHWFSVIQSSRQFLVETTAGDNMIVFANFDGSDSSSTSSVSDTECIALDRISLPWKEKYWNLYVTHCNSTIEVWARIVGKEYSDQLDSIMTDVDLSMMTLKTRPTSIICGQIYLVSVSECWHRVRVENMNKSAGKCFCFFIDFGDEEWLPMDQLFVCEQRFLRLPPQAIPLILYGLEDFAENPNAKIHLTQMLYGKTLIGEILTKKETFELMNDPEVDFNARIQAVLYDTSSNEDVNLNPLMLTKICDDTPPPELKRTGATNVNITHVNANGEIFVQVKNVALSYIQKLINQLVESKFKEEEHQVVLGDLKKPDSLFLVQDMDDLKWYRGALVPEENKIAGNQYNISYVDFGMVKMTNISRIFRLESLSAALSKFPRQALKVKLHNLPPIDESIVARIRGLLPTDCPTIVKLAVHAIVPHVIIYRRGNEGLFNVNEVIRIEYELESSSDLQDLQANGGSNDSIGIETRSNSAVSTHGSLKSPITVPTPTHKGDLTKLSPDVSVPPVDEYFEVFVTMSSNPSNFVVQPYAEAPKLAEMMKSLQEYCLNSDEFIPADMVEVGQAYAAPNSEGIFNRVVVENMFDSSTILVCSYDYGEVAVLSNDKLKTLPAKYRTLPKQAIVAKLHGIKPKHGDWTMNDCMRFKELVVANRFVSIIKNISIDAVCANAKIIELQLVDVTTDEDVYIHELLIKEDRAIPDV